MSQMQKIASSARGRLVGSQEELLKIATNQSPFKEEVLDHFLSEVGFRTREENEYERMSQEIFRTAIKNLLKYRPSAHIWDVKPDAPFKEVPIFIQSPEAFRTTFEEKATLLSEEFDHRPNMEGFRIELHNVGGTTTGGERVLPSLSMYVYETTEDFNNLIVPIKIWVRWRTNF